MRKTLLLLICYLFVGLYAVRADGVAETDEAASLLRTFANRPTQQNADKFFAYLLTEEFVDEPIVLKSGADTETLQATVWFWAEEWYQLNMQNYALAANYGEKALPLCKQIGDKQMEADCVSSLAIIYLRKGDFIRAAEYAKYCNRLDIESGDKDNIASSYNTLAGIYMTAHNPQEAEKYILKAIEYVEQTDNLPRKAVIYGVAAEVYQNLRDVETSLSYADRSLLLEQQMGRTDRIAIRQAQRASALLGLKRYDEAREALTEAIPVLRQMGNNHSLGIACVQMGDVLHKQKQDSISIDYYNEAVEIFTEQHDLYNLSQAYDGLREAWRRIDAQQALLYNDKFLILQDSLYDKETGELLSKYAAEYDNQALIRQNIEQRIKYRRVEVWIVIVFSSLLLALLVFIVLYRRSEKQKIEQIKREIEDIRKTSRATIAVRKSSKNQTETGESAEEITLEQKLLKKVVEEVEKAMERRDYNVETIAQRIGMSERTFRRRIQELTNSTPKDVICAVQMEKAQSLLLGEPEMPILDIAIKCGFEDTSSFSHTFKRIFSVSPTQFRVQNVQE